MGVLGGLKNSIAFLTIIPLGMDKDGLTQAANWMLFFPLIGAVIGFVTGVLVWMLGAILSPLIAGMLGLGFLLLITGVHHTDGLLDFGDAIMSHGTREEKIRIMHDLRTGAGGLSLGLVVLATTAVGISNLDRGVVIQGLVASEAAAKFALVLQASTGRSAFNGMNTPFVTAMHARPRWLRLTAAFALFLVATLPTLKVVGIMMALSAVSTAAIMLTISNTQFGGITGDVMGATNDLTRMVSLLAILVAIG